MVDLLDLFLFACLLSSCFISLVSSTWLLKRLGKLRPDVQRRIFPRQLASLAYWNVIFIFVGMLPSIVINWYPTVEESLPFPREWKCWAIFSVFSTLRFVPVAVEAHTALTFLHQALRNIDRRRELEPWLQRIPPTVLALGVLMATGDALILVKLPGSRGKLVWANNMCVPGRLNRICSILVLLVGFSICTVSYVLVLRHSFRGEQLPGSVRGRAMRRAGAYMLAYMLSFGPILFCYCYMTLAQEEIPVMYYVGVLCESLSGAMNTATYAYHSRYTAASAVISEEMAAERSIDISLNLEFRDNVSVREIDLTDDAVYARRPYGYNRTLGSISRPQDKRLRCEMQIAAASLATASLAAEAVQEWWEIATPSLAAEAAQERSSQERVEEVRKSEKP